MFRRFGHPPIFNFHKRSHDKLIIMFVKIMFGITFPGGHQKHCNIWDSGFWVVVCAILCNPEIEFARRFGALGTARGDGTNPRRTRLAQKSAPYCQSCPKATRSCVFQEFAHFDPENVL